jgi:hypothetical protein
MNRKRVPKAIVHQVAAQFYDRFVEGIKKRVRTAQVKVALAANVDRLANDLQREFPKLPGYSVRNLKHPWRLVTIC